MKRLGLLDAAVLGAALAFLGAVLWAVHRHGAIDKTGSCLNNLSAVLTNEQPAAVDERSLRKLLERYPGVRDCLRDGWGHPIRFRVEERGGKRIYSVISYGSDGKPGPGRVPRLSRDPRADWVMRDGQYRP